MNKFDKIYEEVINEFVKSQKDVTDEDITKIADSAKLDDKETQMLIDLMRKAFEGQNLSSEYIKEWAERIKKKTAWTYADKATRKVLDELGYELSSDEQKIKKSFEK